MTSIQIIQHLTNLNAGLAAGAAWYTSTTVIPLIRLAPSSIGITQWEMVFRQGTKMFPTLAVISALGYGYLGYQKAVNTYYYAAAASVAIIPFTGLFMIRSCIKPMLEFVARPETLDTATFMAYLDKFSLLHSCRAGLLTIAAGTGLYALLNTRHQ